MQDLEQDLELPEGGLVNRFSTKVDEVRLNHYSPLPTEGVSDGKDQRAWPHTDFGMLILLFQEEEVEDRSSPKSSIPIPGEPPTEMSIYVSDTLELLTNKYLRADIRQVVTPIGVGETERYSTACLLKADRETSVGPLE